MAQGRHCPPRDCPCPVPGFGPTRPPSLKTSVQWWPQMGPRGGRNPGCLANRVTCGEGATELSSDSLSFCCLLNHRRGSGCVKSSCADQNPCMSLFWLWDHTCCDQDSLLKGPRDPEDLNLAGLRANQVPYPLYYLFSPQSHAFTIKSPSQNLSQTGHNSEASGPGQLPSLAQAFDPWLCGWQQ